DALGLAKVLCRSWGVKNPKSKSWSPAQGQANGVMERLAEVGWAGGSRDRPRFVDYERLVTSLSSTPLRLGDANDTLVGIDADGKTAAVASVKDAISVLNALLGKAVDVEIDLKSLGSLCKLKRMPIASLTNPIAKEWVQAVPDLAPAVLLAA